MPCTPMAVSAWRTSSSLNGLMIATTSFMVSLGPQRFGRSGERLQVKSGIFLGKWHKNFASLRRNVRCCDHETLFLRRTVGQNAVFADAKASAHDDWGRRMAERSWFYASNGQQQGPIPEAQFRDLIARGSVTPETLVWSEGMSGWQRAGEIPDLMSGASRPPAMPRPGPPPVMAAGAGGSALSIDVGVWELFWRGLVASLLS